ncbi:MAG: YifB family Mg chelatase-like AAA ATPase [Lachnospiraceae bacterium]|nr:YifB family Mg chelatase-like AAA ATPase [Lachnospiraceae bacterium]
MLSTVISGGVRGISSYLMRVEVDAASGLPSFSMVGDVSGDTKEAGERVRVVLKNAGYPVPPMRITVNLSPAAIRKSGVSVDLPIAVGLLCAMGQLEAASLADTLIIGELGLDGEVHRARGILPIVTKAAQAGIRTCMVPYENAMEGAVVEGMRIVGVRTIAEAVLWLQAAEEEWDSIIPPAVMDVDALFARDLEESTEDFADVRGQLAVRRAAEIAAAGFHHLLLIGPPGSGKSMIARRIPGILPPLSREEALEVSAVYSVAGLLDNETALITKRPFIAPHHSTTGPALIGGGNNPRPGLLSLAHRGVLFLDELPEFRRETLDLLRQPLEEKRVQLSRTSGISSYPASIVLLCAMNPCPCGYYPDRNKCRCTQSQISRYLGHISGPILDRIDICVEAPRVEVSELRLSRDAGGESSAEIRKRVLAARRIQEERFAGTKLMFNSQMGPEELRRFCPLNEEEEKLLESLFQAMDLSARAYHKVLRIARTIADLEASIKVEKKHLIEAAGYRMTDSRYWAGKGEGD